MNSLVIFSLIFTILAINSIKANILPQFHCSSFDDPHIRNFQVSKFEKHDVGSFQAYDDNLGVNLYLTYQRCAENPSYTCNVGVRLEILPYFYATFTRRRNSNTEFDLKAGPDSDIPCRLIRIADTGDLIVNDTYWGNKKTGIYNDGKNTNFKCYRSNWGLYAIRTTLPSDNSQDNDVLLYIYVTRGNATKRQSIDGVKLFPSSYYMTKKKGVAPHDIDTSMCGKRFARSRGSLRPDIEDKQLEECKKSLLDSCMMNNFGHLLEHMKDDVNDAIEHCALDHQGERSGLKIGHFQEKYIEKRIIESIHIAHGSLESANDKIKSFCSCRGLLPEPCLIDYHEDCPHTVGLCIEN